MTHNAKFVVSAWSDLAWLYPAFMIALGAQFLPLMFLFGRLGLVLGISTVAHGFGDAGYFAWAGW